MFADYVCGGSGSLQIIKFVLLLLDVLLFIVPVFLILFITVDFVRAVISSSIEEMNKKMLLSVKRIVFCIALFLVQPISNLAMNMTEFSSDGSSFADCVNYARTMSDFSKFDVKFNSSPLVYVADLFPNNIWSISSSAPSSGNDSSSGSSSSSSSTSKGEGSILLVAGHSYAPYCQKFDNECRGPAGFGSSYAEEAETRKLVKLLKSKLIGIGYEEKDVDIVNELLGENFDDKSTTKSLYGELSLDSAAVNSIDFKRYKYAIEIHFNAADGSAKGVTTLYSPGRADTIPEINAEIRSKLVSILGTTDRGDTGDVPTTTLSHFASLNIPFTYLETEFYDNQSAMDIYTAHIDEVAQAIAESIKKYYS